MGRVRLVTSESFGPVSWSGTQVSGKAPTQELPYADAFDNRQSVVRKQVAVLWEKPREV
jgi:hypothetical protein